jgi:two-component system chemotaxis response regulator CheB
MIKTLIIDDSALAREILRDFFEGDENFKVVGEAADGQEGFEKIMSLNPDLVTLDIEMPKMNGLEVIEEVMKKMTIPIVVITDHDNAKTAYEATLRGALEFYAKDTFTVNLNPQKRQEIYETLKRISGIKSKNNVASIENISFNLPDKRLVHAVAIASSTGGPKALSKLFSLIPADFPVPIFLVQHNSEGFDASFAQWLDTFTSLKVKIAEEGEKPEAGSIYIAQTGRHLELYGTDIQNLAMRYNNDEPENNQKPSADVLFRSAAISLKKSVISVVLTGMGSDGADGTRMIREHGGITLAQDEETSLIYGMPKASVETGCVDMVLPLEKIPEELVRLTK